MNRPTSPPSPMRSTLATLTLLFTLLTGGQAQAQDYTTVDLRTSAAVTAGRPLTLKDVATLAGPDAERLATLVLLHADQAKGTASDGTAHLTRDSVRATMDKAPANWARTLLRGGDIKLSFSTPIGSEAVTAPSTQPAALAPAPAAPLPTEPVTTAPVALATPSGPSLKSALHKALAEFAGVTPDNLFLRLDALPAADVRLLENPVPATWRVRVQVLGATPAGRTNVRVEAFESDRVPLARSFTVDALAQRDAIVAGPGGLARDQIITADDLRLDSRLVPVNESGRMQSVQAEQLVGKTLKRRIEAGKPVYPSDAGSLTPEREKIVNVINRGDQVLITAVSGGVVVETRGTATAAAGVGQFVPVQIETLRPGPTKGGKPGEPVKVKKVVTGRVSGPGKAVIDVNP